MKKRIFWGFVCIGIGLIGGVVVAGVLGAFEKWSIPELRMPAVIFMAFLGTLGFLFGPRYEDWMDSPPHLGEDQESGG